MTPEDVLLESIAAASLYGDTANLRRKQAAKLSAAVEAAIAWRMSQCEIRRDD